MDQQINSDLKVVLDYLWQDEKKHYSETPSKNHIYPVLKRLAGKCGYEVNETLE